MLCFHIPCRIIVYGTSNGPQHDTGHCLGPCSIGNLQGTALSLWIPLPHRLYVQHTRMENQMEKRMEDYMEAGIVYWFVALRVQVPNNHILTQNLDYNYYSPNPQAPKTLNHKP